MQKMSEKDAIFVLKRIEAHGPLPIKAKEVAIQALEEIQQYRATGMTPEQIKEMQMDYCAKGAALEEYRAIGTVEELKEMMSNGWFTGAELAELAFMQSELKKYKEIGTVKELARLRSDYERVLKYNDDQGKIIDRYEAIGTHDQCREAVERMKPKKPIKEDSGCYDYDFDYKCPTCGEYIDDSADATCCGKCGQAIDWSE